MRRTQSGFTLIEIAIVLVIIGLLLGGALTALMYFGLLRIPTREEHRSVNLGQAVAICLYEISRKAKLPRTLEKKQLATAGEIDRVFAVLVDALRESGYLEPRTAVLTQEKTRRLLRRLNLSASDAEAMLGMVRQILWKLRSEKAPK